MVIALSTESIRVRLKCCFIKHLYKVLLRKVIVYTTQVTTQSSQSLKAVRVAIVNGIFGMQVLLEDITFNYYAYSLV